MRKNVFANQKLMIDRSKLHNLNEPTVMNLFQTTWTHHMSLSFISYIGK